MHLALLIPSNPQELAGLRARLRTFLARSPLDTAGIDLVVLAVDEAVSNIIRHAYEGRPNLPIRLRADLGPRRLRIRLRDYGRCITGTCLDGRSLDEPAPGGLGLHLIRMAFPTVRFVPRPRGTLLDLRLPWVSPAGSDAEACSTCQRSPASAR